MRFPDQNKITPFMTIESTIHQQDANLETIMTFIYYLVDETYKKYETLVKRCGPKPEFSDSEVITLSLIGQMMNDSENAWHGYVRKNYKHLFPKLVSKSRFHRRAKDLQHLINILRLHWLERLGVLLEIDFIMDSMPVPVCKYARAGRNDRWSMEFNHYANDFYGYCSSKDEKYFGFKLHLLVTKRGIPAHFVVSTANEHDVVLAPDLLESYRQNILTGADKGYVGLHKRLQNAENHNVIIQSRSNQKTQNTPEEIYFLKKYRKTVEITNSILTEQFNIQKSRAISKFGFCARITAKLTALTLAMLINEMVQLPILEIKALIF
jgi:hypothetical protein